MTQFRPINSDHDILLNNQYLSELQIPYIYERFFGLVPTEMDLGEYGIEVMDFVEKSAEYLFGKISNKDDDFEVPSDWSSLPFHDNKLKTLYYIFKKDRILIKISLDKKDVNISICGENVKNLEKWAESIEKLKKKKNNTEIGILCSDSGGRPYVRKIGIDKVELDVELNYGKEFLPIHNKLLEKVKNKTQGIIIAHGGSGNGKTTYIKYLSQKLDRLFIFIPTNQLEILTSPSILTVLLEHPKSILILEDAEKALVSREENENASLVSTVLNIADGILGSMLQVLLIVTFNTEKRNLDSSIYRKGRLLIEWEFKKLSVENSIKLAKHLGKNEVLIKQEMSLADIYNLDDNNFHKEKVTEKIGFNQ